ncbi:MAG TPA: cytochrome c family protein [Xanthobacteraceae bacterium]|jgi:cytochrome c
MSTTGKGVAREGGAVIGAVLLLAAMTNGASAADAEHGKVVFQTCTACHSDKPGAIGPSLRGVYGRKSGALDGFRYSNAMMRANLVWDDANLRAYLTDPQAKVKGNRMPFSGLKDVKDVDDVIAYLEQLR